MSYCIICREDCGHNYTCYQCENIGKKLDLLGIVPWMYPKSNIDQFYKREDENSVFLNIASIISKRSPDSQTQHGCVLAKNRRIIATGYNGWNAGSNDDIIPNVRPHKYLFVIHAELNALLNAAKEGVSVEGATAYITGMPCTECAKALIQCGIKTWYVGDVGHKAQENETNQILSEFLIRHHGVKIVKKYNRKDFGET